MPYFKEKDAATVLAFIKKQPFAVLCGADNDGNPVASHIPLLIEERGEELYFLGHIMRNTAHHKAFAVNNKVLAIFNGPHTYVSASWYTNQQQGSTWNYITVHAKGELRFLNEPAMHDILKKLTAHFENDPASPSLFEHLPEAYITKLSKAIIGFEIKVTSLENVFKLSQNRDEKSYENIIERLQQKDGDNLLIAEEMKKRKDELYKPNEMP